MSLKFDITERLHEVLTVHGIASRSMSGSLVSDLIRWAADSARQSKPELPRYGITWQGPQLPISVPMADGYWTPWHLAIGKCDGNHAGPRCADPECWKPVTRTEEMTDDRR